MKKNKISKELVVLIEEIKDYLDLKYDLVRLDLIEKIVIITSILFTITVILIVVPMIIFFFSIALALFLGDVLGQDFYGFLLVGSIITLFAILLLAFRRKIITNPILKILLRSIFNWTDETKEHHEK